MFNLTNIFKNRKNASLDDIAEILKTTPNKLKEFENAYINASLAEEANSESLFDMGREMALSNITKSSIDSTELENKIVDELLGVVDKNDFTTIEELMSIPVENRPALAGNIIKRDIEELGYLELISTYIQAQNTKNPKLKRDLYNHFRQGLDILDLDPIIYKILNNNKNSISNWFYELENANNISDTIFKIPETKIVKVPLPILQLTRNNYLQLNQTTLNIVNKWAYKAFDLDENETYFVKTGTYSSKFDFRNARVTSPQEVRELGSYLLYIHFQALQMASPLSTPSIYGVSTTNEWVVRKFIKDKENAPNIYKGMPLHTEYRVFIDCDNKEILGISPYWKSNVMLKRFSTCSDKQKADMKHDYIIFKMYEDTLNERYENNKELILHNVEKLLNNLNLSGQWSLDIMQNADDFYLIDMALAENSALIECVEDKSKLNKSSEQWLLG